LGLLFVAANNTLMNLFVNTFVIFSYLTNHQSRIIVSIMKISEILEKLHEEMSDYELAEELGIPQPTIYRLRTAKHNCSFGRGMQIVRLAHQKSLVNIDDFFTASIG